MFIYKITNKINNKIYIGKTVNNIKDRFSRHLNDAFSERLDTHLARAMRKYGSDNFIIEEIDSTDNEEELSEKEIYWIKYYDSYNTGYNMTTGGDGGNTYLLKSNEEMNEIKDKIRISKIGGKNPNSRKVKCLNVCTCEEYHFDSIEDMVKFFNVSNHTQIERRCNGKIRCLFQGTWLIAYEENQYMRTSYEPLRKNKTKINVINTETNEEKTFESITDAEKYFELPHKYFRKNQVLFPKETYNIDKYIITVF